MLSEFEFPEREPLRDTPEGELWTSVLVDAIETLKRGVEWLRSSYAERRSELERKRPELSPARYRERLRDLERERREQEAQLESCRWFFFSDDSPIDFICDVLAYPTDLIRGHARKCLASGSNESADRDPIAA